MKKFLFLLILVLAACCGILITFSSTVSENPVVQKKVAKAPMVWAFSAIKVLKPILFKQP